MTEEYVNNIALALEQARLENYEQYELYCKAHKPFSKKLEVKNLYQNYINKILNLRLTETKAFEMAKTLSKRLVEHITGNYDIGFNKEYEEIDSDIETISNLIANSEISDLEKTDSVETIVDGSVSNGLIYEEQKEKGQELFNKRSEKLKLIFEKSLYNLTHANQILANYLAKLVQMDKSNGLNQNIAGKFLGGIAYELLSGTLVSKRHFTNVTNSQTMLDTINKDGIVHFTSLETANKIMESGYVKPSNFLESDLTAKKSFFFAGTPTLEDILINIPAYHVMTAVKIKPTEEQIKNLKYRVINDGAVTYDGKFTFDKNNAYIAYYGMKFNKETNSLYMQEISEEEAKNYQVSEEVKKNYNYNPKSIISNIKMNAYGLYAEYKHHQKLQQVLKACGMDIHKLDDQTLNEVRTFEEAQVGRTK